MITSKTYFSTSLPRKVKLGMDFGCPRCGEPDTMRIPTYQHASVCNNSQCEALVLRARQARYVVKGNVAIPNHRILREGKYKYIKKYERHQKIYLKTGEILHLITKGSGIPAFSIEGRGWRRYFVDQVEKIYLAGGILSMDPRSLAVYGVKVEPLTEKKIAADLERHANEKHLRALLEQSGTDLYQRAKLRKVRDLIEAKIRTNIAYCLQFADFYMQDLNEGFETLPFTEIKLEVLWDKRNCPKKLRPLQQKIFYLNKIRKIIFNQLDHILFCHQILQVQESSRQFLLELLFEEHPKMRNINFCQAFYPLLKIVEQEQRMLQISPTLNPARIIRRMRSHEGNAEKEIWDLIKEILPKKFRFCSRQIDRFVRTDLYWGSKALDPYNAALNYLYQLLKKRIQISLQKAGFSRYYPGPGLIHQRDSPHTTQTFENKHNQEIIYDLMDTYRPVFRYYLLCTFEPRLLDLEKPSSLQNWLETHQISAEDFFSGTDENEDRVYYPSRPTRKILDHFFSVVCQHLFSYYNEGDVEQLPLEEIMDIETRQFAKYLQDSGSLEYLPFSTFHIPHLLDPKLAYVEVLDQILHLHNVTALRAIPPPVIEKAVDEESNPVEGERQREVDPCLGDPTYLTKLLTDWGYDREIIHKLDENTVLGLANATADQLINHGIAPAIADELIDAAEDHRKYKIKE